MSFIRGLEKAAKGAVAGVGLIAALPVFGAVGTVTAVGVLVGSLMGAAAGMADEMIDAKEGSAHK